jgi:hypothetical protein
MLSKKIELLIVAVACTCLGFAAGRAMSRHPGTIQRPSLVSLPPTGDRCGDPNERACVPGEMSDDLIRLLCFQGLVSAEWMRARGFDAQGSPKRGCELSAHEKETFETTVELE